MSQLEVSKKIDVKRLLMAVAMTAFVVNSAFAASPRADITLAGDTVTVGDVFPGVTHDASFVLAPAPAPGQTLTLNASDLQRISDSFNIGWSSAGYEQAVVRRAARDLGRSVVETAVEQELAKKQAAKFSVRLGGEADFKLPAGAEATVDINNLKYDVSRGEFTATVTAPAGAVEPLLKREISGRFSAMVSVPVLRNALARGQVVTAEDLDYIDMRVEDTTSTMLTDGSKLVGMSPRRGVAAMRPLMTSEMALPLSVKKGETVLMELKTPFMHLTAQGRALESGAEGDTIKVQNASSNQIVQAVVIGTKAVSVQSPDGT
ncbi:MAG: flagellar basal body P-ring formation chaperone FlgA [Alphaproteobacteria bacterium]